MPTSTIKTERKIALPTRYPELTTTSALSQVMVTVSPAVSPRVVARILMIQKPSVTSGTLLACGSELCVMAAQQKHKQARDGSHLTLRGTH